MHSLVGIIMGYLDDYMAERLYGIICLKVIPMSVNQTLQLPSPITTSEEKNHLH